MLCSQWEWRFSGQFSSGQYYRLFLSYIAAMGPTTSNGHTKRTKNFPSYQFSMQWSLFSYLHTYAVMFLKSIWTLTPTWCKNPKAYDLLLYSHTLQTPEKFYPSSTLHHDIPGSSNLYWHHHGHIISHIQVFPLKQWYEIWTVEYIRVGTTMTLAPQLFPVSCATLYLSIQQPPHSEQTAAPSWQICWQSHLVSIKDKQVPKS